MDKIDETATYLGMPRDVAERLQPEVINAITSDDLGEVPPELFPKWDQLTDHDREEILRFRNFLRAAGTPPLTARKD